MKDTGQKQKKQNTISPLTIKDIEHIAKLARLPLTKLQAEELTQQVGVTVGYVSQLQSLSTAKVVEASQGTGMENVYREDVIDSSRMLTQKEALANAGRTHDGFFVVNAVLTEPYLC